jgi:hypothetical protein
MPATSLNNLRQDDDTARAIAEALNSPEQLENNSMNIPVQNYEKPQDYPPAQPHLDYQQPTREYLPPPPQEQLLPVPQYKHPSEEYYMQHYPQEQQTGSFQNLKNNNMNISFQIPEFLKKSLMLLMILLLLNNDFFKQVLSKIPGTLNGDGEHTFILTLLLCLIITCVYFSFNFLV